MDNQIEFIDSKKGPVIKFSGDEISFKPPLETVNGEFLKDIVESYRKYRDGTIFNDAKAVAGQN
jgi:hypothetical protein